MKGARGLFTNAKQLSNRITAQMIFDFLEQSGAEPKWNQNGGITARTICHDGDSHKLDWSPEHGFMCWTNCGHMDIFSLIEHIFDIVDFTEAVNKVKEIFGLGSFQEGFRKTSVVVSDLNPMTNIKPKTVEDINLKKFDVGVLNSFYNGFPSSWEDEGINGFAANKFMIRQDPLNQRTIIPQFDIDNNLIGIRARNFSEQALKNGFKYTPIKYNGIDYKFSTSQNLYGLNVNKDSIKKYKYAIVFEGEKSVLKMGSWYEDSTAVAMNGSNFSEYQLDLLKSLGIEKIYFAFDKDFHGNFEGRQYYKKIRSIIQKARGVIGDVYLIWDSHGLLGYKDSPVDQGKEVFEKLKNEAVLIK